MPQWSSTRLSLDLKKLFKTGMEHTCMVSAALWADSWAALSSLLGARLPLSRSIRSTWHTPLTPSSSGYQLWLHLMLKEALHTKTTIKYRVWDAKVPTHLRVSYQLSLPVIQ